MSTRSFVGVMQGDKCRAVYVHYDGYLEGVGRDLQAYTTQKGVENLIAKGDMSSLGDYYVDRGESDTGPRVYENFKQFFESCVNSWCEYYYIFKDGVWYCGNTYNDTELYMKLVPYNVAITMKEMA